jgi:hypothetical protein
MATKHTVTDSKGQVHTRTSQGRVYSHAIVTHYRTIPAHDNYPEWPGRSACEWASRLDLANKVANQNRSRSHAEAVEVIPAITAAK